MTSNATMVRAGAGIARPRNFVTHLRTLAQERPDDIWLTIAGDAGEFSIGYAVFERRVRALAALLQQRFRPGERALVMLDNGDHYAVSMLACFYAGLIAVPVFPPPSARPQHLARLAGVAADCSACCVLSTAALGAGMAGVGKLFQDAAIVAVDAVDEAAADAWQPFDPMEEDIAFLQYTSGSTAAPKGVIVTHGNLMANERAIQLGMGIGPEDKFVSWAPLYHDMGLIGGLLQPLFSGIPLVLTSPGHFLERPVRWLELISRHRATLSGGPDFSFRLCLERISQEQVATLDLSSWRVAYTGAEPVRADTVTAFIERFGAAGFDAGAVYPCYGLAEATLYATGGHRGAGMVARSFSPAGLAAGQGVPSSEAEAGNLLVGCGEIAVGHHLEIVDPDSLDALEDGAVGEICIAGPSIGAGYWGNKSASSETFVPRGGRRWLRTGDLGFRADGQLYVAGRRKELIIIRGHNLYPQDIERVVEAEVDIVRKGRVAAFAAAGPQGEGIGVAAEVSRSIQKLVPPQRLVEVLSAAVSEVFGEPLAVVLLLKPGTLPRTTSGKLQRSACRTAWLQRSPDAYAIHEHGRFVTGDPDGDAAEAPALDPLARELEAIWREVLSSAEPAPWPGATHFFARGGNSLSAARAAARIAARWGIEFPVRLIFEQPRLQSCASAVRERLAQRAGEGSRARAPTFAVLPPARRLQGLPLSHAQERQWFLWQLDPQSAAYHVSVALRLDAGVDADLLQGALADLVARHESLRTAFRAGPDGVPAQWILAPGDVPLERIDLRALSPEVRATQEAQALRRLRGAPFDLGRGGLLRAALIRSSDECALLLLVMHHIVSDAASMQLLVTELAEAHDARLRGREPVFAPLPLQCADHAVWQRAWLAAGEAERQAAWWRSQLGDAHPVLELRTDHPRLPHARYGAARQGLLLPAALLARLRQRAQGEGVTLFIVLLAGLQVLLHRYSGQRDIRVGTAFASRGRLEFESIVGLFVNTLVLRSLLDGRTTLADALAQAREAVAGAQAHPDLPFEQLVQMLHPERGLSHHPLFQVMFNHVVEDTSALQAFGSAAVDEQALPDLEAQFELVLESRERSDGGLKLDFIYAAELYEAATIERMASHYLRVLEALAADPSQAVGELVLNDAAERAQSRLWSVNAESEPDPEPVHHTIARQARRQPDAVALLFGDETLRYAELDHRANQLAHRLIALGVRPGNCVGVAMQRSVDLVVGLLAILKAGAAWLPLDPDYPAQRLAYMVEDSGLSLVLAHRSTRGCIASGAGVAVLEVDGLALDGEPGHEPAVALHGEHLAYVIYTSGSTGRPKGVAVRHAALHNCMAWMQRSYGLSQADAVLHKAPFGFDVSVWEIFWPLTAGARLVVARPGDHRDLERLVQLIERHQVSTLNFVPSMLQAFLDHPAIESRTRLRYIMCGGEAMPAETQREALRRLPGVSLQNLYGPTETTIHVTRWPCSDAGAGLVPIGRPISATGAWVLDAELNPVPRGAAGELYLGGVQLARGYLHRAGLTAERFVADPAGGGARLYRTGDLARWNAEGQIEYLGRIDHQLKIRGLRIELGEIEAQLLAQPELRESVVVARPGPAGPMLVAYATARLGQPVDSAALRERLRQVLPDYMVPQAIVLLDALPLNANGKVDRAALPAPAGHQPVYARDVPEGEVARALAAIWCELLELPQVGLHDNFFELGGHSLLLIRAHRLLEDRMRITLPLVELFRHPTVASLAHAVEQRGASTGGAAATEAADERALRQRAARLQRRQAAGKVNA
ncbi:MAG: amino acid adenylation domain-containing protein [Pseudacidovorax sp.]|nr:amino acid adenylation domain-containing protein [Pseudacidovorax sp.]